MNLFDKFKHCYRIYNKAAISLLHLIAANGFQLNTTKNKFYASHFTTRI